VLPELRRELGDADAVLLGSYFRPGIEAADFLAHEFAGPRLFYDIDTPVTLAKLERNDTEYIAPRLIPRYHLYLSFTGGPTLELLRQKYGSPVARALYCSVDPDLYYPEPIQERWDLGYLGTYSDDRQPTLETLMLEPARRRPAARMVVAGPLYPAGLRWPPNVERIEHLSPSEHREFYNAQRFTLNITRADMVKAGFSPSVRLFEAGACGTPIISDYWNGLETLFEPGKEILVASKPEDTLAFLTEIPEDERAALGANARARVLSSHTSAHRAAELVCHVRALR
jgi:spore maturation protein CgeB